MAHPVAVDTSSGEVVPSRKAPESIADSEDSLSISLPSEGPTNPFSEIRAGILKIFDDAATDNDTAKPISTFNPEQDFPSFDNVIFDEKHEFEKTEKMISSLKSAASTTTTQLPPSVVSEVGLSNFCFETSPQRKIIYLKLT